MSGLFRFAARCLLGWIFMRGGLDVLQHPENRVKTASGFLDQARSIVPMLPEDKTLMVRANAGVMVVSGALLAIAPRGLARLAALALCASLVPTTLGGHPYWAHEDAAARAQQRIHFDKNLAMFGGLLYFALHG